MAPRADLPSLRCSLAGGLTEFGQPSLFLVAATAAESFEMEAAELILDDAEDLTAAALLLATGSTGYNLHSPNSQSTEASSEHCDSEEYLPDLSDIPFSASITSPTFCTGLAESAANCPETPSLETQTPDSETTETVNATSTALLHGLAATSIVTPTSATEAQRAGCHSSLLTVTTLATHLYSSALILPSVSSAGCLIMPGQAKAPSTPSIEPEPSGAVASVNISHGSRVTNVPAIAVPLPNPSSFTSALKSETRASFLNQDLSAATMLPTHLIDPTHTPETETFSGKPCGLDAFIGQELDNASGIHQPQLRRLVQPQELGERVMRLLRARSTPQQWTSHILPFTDLPGLRFLVASDLLQVSDTSSDLLIVVGCDEAPDWTSCRLTCCQAGLEHVFDSRPTSYAANDLFHFRHRTHKSNAESRILLDRSRERSPFALTARECAGPQPILLEVFDNHCRIGQSDSSSSLRSAFGLSHTWHILPGLLPGLASCQLSPHSSHISTSCIVYLLLIEIVSPQSGHPTFMRASHPSPSPGLSLIGGILAKATNCCSTEGFQSRFCESAMDSNRPLLLRLPESVVYGPNSTGSADAEPSFRHELIGEPNTWYACLACLVDVVRVPAPSDASYRAKTIAIVHQRLHHLPGLILEVSTAGG